MLMDQKKLDEAKRVLKTATETETIDAALDEIAFRIGVAWDLLFVPVVILILICLTTVSFQIIRGAKANPARILRSE